MPKAKATETSTTKLTHLNGVTVSVDSDKADALVAGGLFSTAKRAAAKSES